MTEMQLVLGIFWMAFVTVGSFLDLQNTFIRVGGEDDFTLLGVWF